MCFACEESRIKGKEDALEANGWEICRVAEILE